MKFIVLRSREVGEGEGAHTVYKTNTKKFGSTQQAIAYGNATFGAGNFLIGHLGDTGLEAIYRGTQRLDVDTKTIRYE